MQLDKLVSYHKALSDPTRLRILRLVAARPLSGQELAARLGVTAPTITHHVLKLREAGLLYERREKNTIYFSLNRETLEAKSRGTVEFVCPKPAGREGTEMTQANDVKFRESVLKNFFTKEGRLKTIPAQLKKKIVILERLAEQLELGKAYAEKEINEFLKRYHEDYATLRRELIMQQFMYRENEIYELNPREVWTKWQDLH